MLLYVGSRSFDDSVRSTNMFKQKKVTAVTNKMRARFIIVFAIIDTVCIRYKNTNAAL